MQKSAMSHITPVPNSPGLPYIVIRFSFQANWKNIQEVSKKTVNDISQ